MNSGIAGTMQYGFASTSITLNQPITIAVPVSSSYDGATLPVYQSENGGVTWTEIRTCVVSSGICSFTTSDLSSFAVIVPATTSSSTPATSSSVSSASVSSGGGGSAYDLAIDGGATSTPTTSVTLSLYGTEAYTMELSNTPSFASSTWIPYVTTMPWMLAQGAGEQSVSVQFRTVGDSIVGTAEASIDLVPAEPSASPSSSPSTSSTSGMTVSQMETLLASLEAQLQALEAETGTTSPLIFTRNLQLHDAGNDVKQLQQFLIAQNIGPAARALKAHGVTKNFGTLTENALSEFQKKVGITPASGYFGPITRKYVENLAP
jgi:hypothetical protein